MCGIAGIYNYGTKKPIDTFLLQRMSNLIAHRGPDDSGSYVDNHIGLVHRRLSIIDLSTSGHQPMSNQDRTIWITYNGECYNYKDFYPYLRSKGHTFKSTSDTEVILHLYEEHGLDFLEKIDGMFAFAIWDSRYQRLLLARDRIGIKPLLYCYDNNRLLFSSELKALLAEPSVSRAINYDALGDYFRYMSIPDPDSIFSGVKKLLPGHCLVVENDTVKLHQYWDIESIRPHGRASIKKTSEEFIHHFQQSVTSHMIADVPVGAFLSGGIDSSGVVAFASQTGIHVQSISTFSITFRGLDEFDESGFAIQVAKRYGTDHHEFDLTPDLITVLPKMIWHADEPFAVSSAFALYFLSELTSQYTKVVMSGDGSDEIFAGYPWRHWNEPRLPSRLVQSVLAGFELLGLDRLCKSVNLYQRGRKMLMRSLATPADNYERTLLCFQPDEIPALLTTGALQVVMQPRNDNVIHRYYDRQKDATQLTRKLYTDLKTTLVSEMLTKVDRMTMAFGLEARVPFLDHHLVEWAFQLPDSHKLHGFDGKYILKRALACYLPQDVIHRPKHGFNVPLKVWLRGQLKEMAQDVLLSKKIQERGLFQRRAIENILESHFHGDIDHSDKIFVLMVLELWFQQFVDRPLSEWQKF